MRYAKQVERENERIYAQMSWSNRWTPIIEQGLRPLSGERYNYWHSKARFIVVAAGLRSLKTEIGKRRLIRSAMRAIPDRYGARRYAFTAPTYGQAKAIAWQDLIALCPRDRIVGISGSELKILLSPPPEYIHEDKNAPIPNTEVWLAGLDNPARIEGRSWDGIHMTEYADMPNGLWGTHIRPLVADRNGFITIEGRPDWDAPNNDNFKELFEFGLREENEEWESFRWSASDIISELEYASLRETMTEEQIAQEANGDFVSAPGRAYPQFGYNTHVSDEVKYDPTLPLLISCDFNAEHHNWGIYQYGKDGVYKAIDEIYIQGGMVEFMIKDLKDRLETFRIIKQCKTLKELNLVFYGDYSGENRNAAATFTAWKQIKNAFQEKRSGIMMEYAEFNIPRHNPPVSDRINAVCAALMNAAGQIHLRVSPKCRNLIRDFEKVSRRMLFAQLKGDELTHASDNCGYMIIRHGKETNRKGLFAEVQKQRVM